MQVYAVITSIYSILLNIQFLLFYNQANTKFLLYHNQANTKYIIENYPNLTPIPKQRPQRYSTRI